MKIMTISEVSRHFNISTRMLRYYEKEGLINSTRIDNYSYRVYEEEAIQRLQQILVFRKLRVPIKQIAVILDDEQQFKTLEIMKKNLSEIDEEISALNIIKNIIKAMVSKLDENIQKRTHLDLLKDNELMDIVHILNPPKTNLKESYSMNELSKASKVLEQKMDVRIVYLPPVTVAAYQYIGENPEDMAGEKIYSFIKEKNLSKLKPDFRLFGFNNPSPQDGQKVYGYEFWVTIPENMQVNGPIVKKQFNGGLYAAHCINFGDFYEWGAFIDYMNNNKIYEIDWREPNGMGGCLEEELNIFTNIKQGAKKAQQLDLFIPIKERTK